MKHVAIDLGRPNSMLGEFDSAGNKVLRRFRLDRPNLVRLFSDRPRCRVLIEACTDSEWVARVLEDLGHEVIVADPNYAAMYGERTRKIKTDGRDVAALLDANRLGIYRPAHRRSAEQAEVMGLLSMRDGLIRARTGWINLVRAQLRREGFTVRTGSSQSFVNRVGELNLSDRLKALIAHPLALMPRLNEQLAQLDRQIVQLGRRDPRAQLLQSAPRVGAQTSVAFVALVDDVRRFPKAHRLESYLGVVPSEWSSSERRLQGSITKRGDSRVRYLLVEAAWSILRSRDPQCFELQRWAQAIAARRGSKVAVVALARRLAGILYAILRDNRPFDPTRIGSHQPRRKAA